MIAKAFLAVTALVTVAFAPPATRPAAEALPSPESVRHIPELAWHAAARLPDCSVTCWDNHQASVHVAFNGGNTNERAGGAHDDPYAGLCAEKHPGCVVEVNLIESAQGIQAAIDANNAEALTALLERNGGKVYLAVERNALQVIGCRGDVVGHFRIPANLQRALTE